MIPVDATNVFNDASFFSLFPFRILNARKRRRNDSGKNFKIPESAILSRNTTHPPSRLPPTAIARTLGKHRGSVFVECDRENARRTCRKTSRRRANASTSRCRKRGSRFRTSGKAIIAQKSSYYNARASRSTHLDRRRKTSGKVGRMTRTRAASHRREDSREFQFGGARAKSQLQTRNSRRGRVAALLRPFRAL